MGKITGFLEYEREDRHYEPVEERIKHWREFVRPLPEEENKKQAARCMDCGVPYCHTGCPVNNQIPDWNDLVYRGNWEEAARNLHSTNNFPEITGRICPAPCEAACTLNIEDNPVTIKTIECAIADRAFEQGWVKPEPPANRTGKKVAIVGSGPAGLACAQQLARAGHDVHVFEKFAKAGGLLTYGIPDFKMDKQIVAHRVAQMEAEGVTFHYNAHVGVNRPAKELLSDYDALVLAGGAEQGRDLPIPGRDLKGIHFAMEFLPQQNRRVSGEPDDGSAPILADGKHVVVIGGGDTGSDCIGTSIRQGARSVTNFEIMPQPPLSENKPLTWPDWPLKLRTSSSHEEGVKRDFAVLTTKFSGQNGEVKKLHCTRVDEKIKPIPGTEFEIDADLVLLAMGFVHPVHEGMIEQLGLALDQRGNVKADTLVYQSSNPKVFTAGDMRPLAYDGPVLSKEVLEEEGGALRIGIGPARRATPRGLLLRRRISLSGIRGTLSRSGLGWLRIGSVRRGRSREISRRRLDVERAAARPAGIIGPSARSRDRLALGERARHGCVRGGSSAAAADEFFRPGLHGGQRHHRSGQRPLRGAVRLGIRRLEAGIDRQRQRDWHAPVSDAALDLALDVVGKLAGAELGVIDAVAAAQAANLSFVIRPLRRVAARLVDEAVPDVDIHDSRLLGPAAVELVEIGGIGARLGAALRRQTYPHHRNAGALEGGDGRIDAPDIGELPLLRVEFPRSIGCLARLLRRHVGVFGSLGGGGRLLLRVGRRGRNWRGCGRAWLCRLRIRLGRGG